MQNPISLLGLLFLLANFNGLVLAAEQLSVTDNQALVPSARIVGGFSTTSEQTPATVALLRTSRVQFDGDLFQAQFCGGTVIAAKWVLTAAHCVVDIFGNQSTPDSVLILTGSTDLGNPVNQPIPVTRIIPHPLFRSVQQGRDIALIELEFDSNVEPVALDTQTLLFNDLAFISGWGALKGSPTGTGLGYPTKLQGAFVNMIPGAICGQLYPGYSGLTSFSIICAGVPEGGKDSCQGDSGGPLYRVDSTENRVTALAGITSWGIGCGLADYPGIYTRVATYARWIQANLATSNVQSVEQPANDDNGPAARVPTKLPVADASTLPAGPISDAYLVAGDSGGGGVVFYGLLPLLAVLFWRRRSISRLDRLASLRIKQASN